MYRNGRHWLGPGNQFIKFPSIAVSVELGSPMRYPLLIVWINADIRLSGKNVNALRARTIDGFNITIEASYHYKLIPDEFPHLFNAASFAYEQLIQVESIKTVREVSGKYTAQDFFTRRREIGDNMLYSMNSNIRNRTLGVEIILFQFSSITMDDDFEKVVISQQIAKQQAFIAEEQRLVNLIKKETDKLLEEKRMEKILLQKQAEARAVEIIANATKEATRILAEAATFEYETLRAGLSFNDSLISSYRFVVLKNKFIV